MLDGDFVVHLVDLQVLVATDTTHLLEGCNCGHEIADLLFLQQYFDALVNNFN
jgi:hypothetical protein